MNPYIQFLLQKIKEPKLGVRARAMASIALLQQGIPISLPDFKKESFEGTAPGTKRKIHLYTALAGDNAWAGIVLPLLKGPAGLPEALAMAESLMALQAPSGGIYLSTQENMDVGFIPQGDISFAHTIDVYKSFRFLFEMTHKSEFGLAKKKIEDLFRSNAFNCEKGFFNAGSKPLFATDVQLGALLEFGPTFLGQIFGHDAAYQLWRKSKEIAGRFDSNGNLTGLGLLANDGKNNAHAESTIDAILILKALSVYYPGYCNELLKDAESLTQGLSEFIVADQEGRMALRKSLISQQTWWGDVLTTEADVEATAAYILLRQ